MATIAFVSEFDCGGRNQVWCDVINDLTPHMACNVVYHATGLRYGQDAFGHDAAAMKIAEMADVIVACPGMDHGQRGPARVSDPSSPACTYDGPFLPLPNGKRWCDLGKPVVILLWGSLNLRAHYRAFHDAFDGFAAVWCADCDVAIDGGFRMAPMPNYYPWLEGEWPDEWPIRVCHTATDRKIKNTAALIEAIGNRTPEILLDIIEREPLRDSLKRKAKAHVNFDHLQGYFGNSSFEATAIGLPNIVALGKPEYRDAIKDAWQSDTIPPWHICVDMAEATGVVEDMLTSDTAWEESAVAHYRWHLKHFLPRQIVERLFVSPCQ